MAAVAPMGMGRMYGPISPPTKAIGRMAAMTASVARIVGLPTSSTASMATSFSETACVAGQSRVANDVFHDHDGVVHENADREYQREKCDAVERVAVQIKDRQCQRERDGNRREDHQRFAHAQRESDEHADRDHGDEHVEQQFVGFFRCGLAVMARDRQS